MLSEYQQKCVWEGMLTSEFRALYFADLAASSQNLDKWIGFATLSLSAGFIVSAVARVPETLSWIQIVFSIAAGVLGMLRVSMQYYKRSVDSSDLAMKWQKVQREYEALWADIYREDATDILSRINTESDELTKPGIATGAPNKKKLEHWWKYVIEHRTANA